VGRVRGDEGIEIRGARGESLARLTLTEVRDAHQGYFQG